MQATIDFSVLKGLTHLVAVQDVRHYLNGVFIAANGDAVVITSHHMGLIAKSAIWIDAPKDGLIIPTAVIDAMARKLKKANWKKPVEVRHVAGLKWEISLFSGDHLETFAAVDGTFPDYTRIKEKDPTEHHTAKTPGQFNWNYMVDFCKCCAVAGHSKSGYEDVRMWHRDGNRAFVTIPSIPGFHGVLMGLIS